jgi:hypothetical protein
MMLLSNIKGLIPGRRNDFQIGTRELLIEFDICKTCVKHSIWFDFKTWKSGSRTANPQLQVPPSVRLLAGKDTNFEYCFASLVK